ncbi:MAG: HD family hydrolase [Chloroflexota bacterium]
MNVTSILKILFHGNQLKRTARTGWVQRGVPNSENVAAHSYGVVFATLVLAQVVSAEIDLERALAMAALHDLPEGLTTDVPTPAWRYMPEGIKTNVERGAMQEIVADNSFADEFMSIFEELHEKQTAVSRLVDDADKLDMFIQAIVYEEQTGNQHLQEFWQRPYSFHYPEVQQLYAALVMRRQND